MNAGLEEKKMKNKKAVVEKAFELGAVYTKVRTKTVSFADLARDSAVFIQFNGLSWANGYNRWDDLKACARENGFILSSSI